MYKIFFGNRIIYLDREANILNRKDIHLFYRYSSIENLQMFIENFDEVPQWNKVCLFNENFEQMVDHFKSIFTFAEAAGGVVVNESGKVLLIKRNGIFDLPKGHVEKGETYEETALREVKEETGLKHLKIDSTLHPTFHTYISHDIKHLKKTYWYLMKGDEKDALKPQSNEGIEEVFWCDIKDLNKFTNNMYASLLDVLKNAGLII